MKERKNLKAPIKKYTVSMVIETKVVIGWFKLQLWKWLVDNFEGDWFFER